MPGRCAVWRVEEADSVEYGLGDIVQTRKTHPCGSDRWRIIRVGADIKIKCEKCGRIVMMERAQFDRRLKKVLEREEERLDDGSR